MCNVVESGNGLTKILLQNTTALIGQREAVIKFRLGLNIMEEKKKAWSVNFIVLYIWL